MRVPKTRRRACRPLPLSFPPPLARCLIITYHFNKENEKVVGGIGGRDTPLPELRFANACPLEIVRFASRHLRTNLRQARWRTITLLFFGEFLPGWMMQKMRRVEEGEGAAHENVARFHLLLLLLLAPSAALSISSKSLLEIEGSRSPPLPTTSSCTVCDDGAGRLSGEEREI